MTILETEISAISLKFGIPIKKIKDTLKKSIETILEDKIPKKVFSLSFNDFEADYVLAKNNEEELLAIKKFLPSCSKANQTKLLFDLCPENELELRKQIIHDWILLCHDLSELREPKRLVEKNTPDSELAYKMYKKLFF